MTSRGDTKHKNQKDKTESQLDNAQRKREEGDLCCAAAWGWRLMKLVIRTGKQKERKKNAEMKLQSVCCVSQRSQGVF